ncbi:MAG: KEOPS complex N(6)-L-threonylcarbamoyladenine synthase Kae1 [Thermoprotei archaeon]
MSKLVLGIESTAHTFGVGIASSDGRILANARDTYKPPKGGIHPRECAKHHALVANSVLKQALTQSNVKLDEISAIAVALGPGLGPCLRIGATTARTLALLLNVPLIPVNHGIAHIEIAKLTANVKDPLVVFVSGGHTSIMAYMDGRYRVFGETLDVALGNFLDSLGEELGFPFPGLVSIEKIAESGKQILNLPYTVKGQDLSFSGLYTSALRAIKNGARIEDVCLSIVEYSYSMLCEVVERALAFLGKESVILTGGVARSNKLQKMLSIVASLHSASFHVVPDEYAGDNGAMIAWTGVLMYQSGITIPIEESSVRPRWRIDEVDIPWMK